jgi:hypothetical protein
MVSGWLIMAKEKQGRQKNCKYCGRFFTPDYRVWDRQVSCARKICRAKRKKDSQAKWVKANPDYFHGRYENTKEWREQHPDYQKQWRAEKRSEIQDKIPHSTPVKSVRIVVPVKWLKDEIQDEIILARRCRCGFYVTGRGVQDTRRDRYL